MTVKDKELFINNFLNSMRNTFLSEIEKFPEEWDGIELRAYIAGAFKYENSYSMGRKRKANYNNERYVRNLKY